MPVSGSAVAAALDAYGLLPLPEMQQRIPVAMGSYHRWRDRDSATVNPGLEDARDFPPVGYSPAKLSLLPPAAAESECHSDHYPTKFLALASGRIRLHG